MQKGNINIITPPDRFFGLDTCYLLVNPSTELITEFSDIVSVISERLNVYVYDTAFNDIEWLLSAACQSHMIIIDIDNCTPDTQKFVSFLLTHPHTVYITKDEITPYYLISNKRIFDLNWIVESINYEEDDEEPFA